MENTTEKWEGLTLDELRYRRAKMAIKAEMGTAKMMSMLTNTQNNVKNNGLRQLLFNNNLVSGLKFVDYLVIGFQITRWLTRIRRKFK